jgi:hypothetical protein
VIAPAAGITPPGAATVDGEAGIVAVVAAGGVVVASAGGGIAVVGDALVLGAATVPVAASRCVQAAHASARVRQTMIGCARMRRTPRR